jgi:hypothetical protein
MRWLASTCHRLSYLFFFQARVVGILGGIDEAMMQRGRYSHRFFTVRAPPQQEAFFRAPMTMDQHLRKLDPFLSISSCFSPWNSRLLSAYMQTVAIYKHLKMTASHA